MRAGKLRHVAVIERGWSSVNEAGTPSTDWAELVTLRAELVERSLVETVRAQGATDEAKIILRTRFHPEITSADRVMFDGLPWNIRQLEPIGHNRGLEFHCTRVG